MGVTVAGQENLTQAVQWCQGQAACWRRNEHSYKALRKWKVENKSKRSSGNVPGPPDTKKCSYLFITCSDLHNPVLESSVCV